MAPRAPRPASEPPLHHIRDVVRRERAYLVGGVPDLPIKLNQNESPFDLPADLKRELLQQFMDVPFNRYPGEQPDRLRRALGERLGLGPDSVLVGNGSNELTYTLGMAFIDRGTPVVLPRPMFSLYEKVVRLHGGDLTAVAPLEDLRFDVAGLLAAIERVRPALTVITTPNNPTGLAVSMTDLEAIVAAAPGFVVIDEAYAEFVSETARDLLDRHPNVILLRTLSKACGLAGLRLGYLVARPVVVAEMLKARLPFMVDVWAETVALAVLDRPDLILERVKHLKQETVRLTVELQALPGVQVVPSQANFVIFRTGVDPRVLIDRLANAGVMLRDMGGYPELRGYVRVNAGLSEENQRFLTALRAALQGAG